MTLVPTILLRAALEPGRFYEAPLPAQYDPLLSALASHISSLSPLTSQSLLFVEYARFSPPSDYLPSANWTPVVRNITLLSLLEGLLYRGRLFEPEGTFHWNSQNSF